jgi:hypothetical protein
VSEIKVTDKRMFTPDGRLKEEFEEELARTSTEPEAPSAAPSPAPAEAPAAPSGIVSPAGAPAAAPSTGAAPPAAGPEKAPTGLLELVQFLGDLTLACLGDVPLPDGRLLRDLDGARTYIDLIGSLVERFGASLAPQDRSAAQSFLDQLRLRYVSRKG